MIEITIPAVQSHLFILQQQRKTLKGGGAQIESGDSSVGISEVITRRLTSAQDIDDAELQQFYAEQSTKYRFDYMRLGCTFDAGLHEKFEQAWLSVKLSYSELTDDQPMVWSMAPEEKSEVVKSSYSVKIDAKFKILEYEAGPGFEIKSEDEKRVFSLRAFREGKGAPYWQLSKTSVENLSGSFLFHMVLRSLKEQKVNGKIDLIASIKSRKFILFYENHDLEKEGAVRFDLLP